MNVIAVRLQVRSKESYPVTDIAQLQLVGMEFQAQFCFQELFYQQNFLTQGGFMTPHHIGIIHIPAVCLAFQHTFHILVVAIHIDIAE